MKQTRNKHVNERKHFWKTTIQLEKRENISKKKKRQNSYATRKKEKKNKRAKKGSMIYIYHGDYEFAGVQDRK